MPPHVRNITRILERINMQQWIQMKWRARVEEGGRALERRLLSGTMILLFPFKALGEKKKVKIGQGNKYAAAGSEAKNE